MNEQKQNSGLFQPRLIIHGGAGNILRQNLSKEKYEAYRTALLSIISASQEYMNSNIVCNGYSKLENESRSSFAKRPSSLEVATYAVTQLENCALFNSGHGAVFTRDGINELEASVMVSRGQDKRGVGVMGLRRVRNPVLLARSMLEHGKEDLRPGQVSRSSDTDVPSAQGHTQIFGTAAEKLAEKYGLDLVNPEYFFTQQRWDEHKRALEREESGLACGTWDADEYLPQGTCGAVAMDEDGVICAATSTGGMTNKLTGRVGDTPVVGAGFWSEEWTEHGDPTGNSSWQQWTDTLRESASEAAIIIAGPLRGIIAECMPTPLLYSPKEPFEGQRGGVYTTRALGISGTGNGDSFLRINAVRTVAAMARWMPDTAAKALSKVVGPQGELQKSAGSRWKLTGEGEGGMIGIECAVVRDSHGMVVQRRSDIIMDYNCGGMYRAWIDNNGQAVMSVWSNGSPDS